MNLLMDPSKVAKVQKPIVNHIHEEEGGYKLYHVVLYDPCEQYKLVITFNFEAKDGERVEYFEHVKGVPKDGWVFSEWPFKKRRSPQGAEADDDDLQVLLELEDWYLKKWDLPDDLLEIVRSVWYFTGSVLIKQI